MTESSSGGDVVATIPIAVYDPLPVFRQGLLGALERGGLGLTNISEALPWLQANSGGLLLMTIESESDWPPLRSQPLTARLIAVLPRCEPDTILSALRRGAANAVSRAASPPKFRQVVADTLRDEVRLPSEILPGIGQAREVAAHAPVMSENEIEWLRELARGRSVASLAERSSYSERAMYRRLRALYTQLGVTGRTQALVRAHDLGWL